MLTKTNYILLPILFLALTLFLSSCGTTSRVPKSEPVTDNNLKSGNIIEQGVASWYGPNFHGKLTANGETYNMYDLTAAHRTLPFNTVLRVINQDNGEAVVVRVNDRGPFAKNRIIDLSKKAAEEIDMIGNGTAPVQLVLLEGDLENSRTTNLKVATYTVQLGSFEERNGAVQLTEKIRGSRIEEIALNDTTVYRVYYGIYTDKDRASQTQQELHRKGYKGYVKQIEN